MADRIVFTLFGQAASKANSRKLAAVPMKKPDGTLTKVTKFIKSDEARQFELDALRQIPPACRVRWDFPVAVYLRMFYRTQLPDLDESVVLDVIQDRYTKDKRTGERVLVHRGVFTNDRLVWEKHVFKAIDKANPRVEVVVMPLQAMQGMQPSMQATRAEQLELISA